MKIQISGTKGFNKKQASHLIDVSVGQVAVNTHHNQGDIRPWKKPLLSSSLSTTGNQTIFQYDDGTQLSLFASTADLDFVRTPLSNDAFKRAYFSGMDDETGLHAIANDLVDDPFVFANSIYQVGVPAPAAAPGFSSGSTGGTNYRAYVYTYVSWYGEEGPPSPVLSTTTYNTGNVVLNGFTQPTDWDQIQGRNQGLLEAKIRLYRTASTTDGVAAFQFVKEVSVYGITWATFTITDNVSTLGEVLPSVNWYPPPEGIFSLNALPGGFLVAAAAKSVIFSEPYMPHAWNPDYEITFTETVVGLGIIGTSVVVLTDEGVYLVYGSHPENMTKVRLPGYFPCLSKRSIVSCRLGVIYVSHEGFMLVDNNGVINITHDVLSKEDIDAYYPYTMVATYWDGMYIAFFDSTTFGGLVIDVEEGSVSDLSIGMLALFPSPDDGVLYTIGNDGATAVEHLWVWEGDSVNYLQYTWRSKKFILAKDANFSTARVISDPLFYDSVVQLVEDSDYILDLNTDLFADPLLGDINASPFNELPFNGSTLYTLGDVSIDGMVSFNLYVDGVLRYSTSVSGNRIFRLPGGFKGKEYEIEVCGYIPVYEIAIAPSVKEIMVNE